MTTSSANQSLRNSDNVGLPRKTLAKVCGLTCVEDAMVAAAAGAAYLGYVFHPASKRYATPETVHEIVAQVKAAYPEVFHVGVFVDAEISHLLSVTDVAGLDFVQMHGDETPEQTATASEAGLRVIKAFRVSRETPLPSLKEYRCEHVLVDAYSPHAHGGTGLRVDLSSLPSDFPFGGAFVAGGLTPANVAEVVGAYRPFAVDVSSGVELTPGVKDHAKIQLFLSELHRAHSIPFSSSDSVTGSL